ncbi:DNA recombination protein RmuC [Thioalkalivibrio sp. XN279]|uniref:DNA recombination protein RmuC n=1 Tax=Thioalkalivibrio sp. XN279 TaxID=2714953 RepID=UPI00140C61E4|nr:DNA recombination protein RmuC [Thioalkalivibrio sp. XN279]NHA14527.1 DNA recombination protein RmuC [Thioalkalivibrio sp. XN279]
MNQLDLQALLPYLLFAGGLLVGIVATILALQPRAARLREKLAVAQSRLEAQARTEEELNSSINMLEQRLARIFDDLAKRSLQDNSRQFLELAQQNLEVHRTRAQGDLKAREQAVEAMVKPIREALEKTERQISQIERERNEAFGNIRGLLEAINVSQQTLSSETRNLVTALRRPEVRGQWGEMTLRRLVELAGMVEHCDFTEQEHTVSSEGVLRPDMIVHLAEGRQLVVDVKTPLDAYLAAVEASDDATREAALQRHARKVRERVRELAAKRYWAQFERSPEFVILFIPGDQFLSAALARDPGLLDEALNQHVILATPTSLVALLKAVAYGWRQVALAENARQIRDLAAELHRRLATFTGHLARVGRALSSSVDAYNSAVGSLERQVMPGARKFVELGVQAQKPLDSAPEVDLIARTPRGDPGDSAADAADDDGAGEAAKGPDA